MKQICSICGEEDEELFMFRIQTSRVQWMCDSCYRNASREVTLSEVMKRRKKKQKEAVRQRLKEE